MRPVFCTANANIYLLYMAAGAAGGHLLPLLRSLFLVTRNRITA